MEVDYIKRGDCLELMKELPDESVDLILTDPPYIISRKTGYANGGCWNNPTDGVSKMTIPITEFGEWDKHPLDLDILIPLCFSKLKEGGSIIIFYDVWKIQELKESLQLYKFKQFRLCRWDKTNPVPVNSKLNYLTNASEYFITAVKKSCPVFNSEYDKGIYSGPILHGKERSAHPTQKPLWLIENLIKKHSKEGTVVLDLFMGSGTTPVACVNTNRHYIGYELDEKYFEIAQKRIEEAKTQKENKNNV